MKLLELGILEEEKSVAGKRAYNKYYLAKGIISIIAPERG